MKKFILSMALLTMMSHSILKAQYYYYNDKYFDNPLVFEIGVSGGLMNAMTDLGGKKGPGKPFIKDLRWQTVRPAYGAYVAAMYQNAIGGRIQGTFGTIVGYDSILKGVGATTNGRYDRNLSFRTKIAEVQLAIEVHPLFFKNYDEGTPPPISPYGVIGAGYYSFDPEAKLNDQWYALRPLRTEGEGFAEYPDHKPYSRNQFNLIGGLGLKYELTSVFNLRLECLYRKLFTDYLDDVSTTYIDPNLFDNYLPPNLAAIAKQLYNRKGELNPSEVTNVGDPRGNSKKNDSYFTIELKIGMTLGRRLR